MPAVASAATPDQAGGAGVLGKRTRASRALEASPVMTAPRRSSRRHRRASADDTADEGADSERPAGDTATAAAAVPPVSRPVTTHTIVVPEEAVRMARLVQGHYHRVLAFRSLLVVATTDSEAAYRYILAAPPPAPDDSNLTEVMNYLNSCPHE